MTDSSSRISDRPVFRLPRVRRRHGGLHLAFSRRIEIGGAHFEDHQFRLLESEKEFLELGAEWDALLESSTVRNPYMSWDWVRLWWQHFGHQHRLAMTVAFDSQGDLAAVVPLVVSGGVWRVLSFLGSQDGVNGEGVEPLVRRGRESLLEPCYAAALQLLDGVWDEARFRSQDPSTPLLGWLEKGLKDQGIRAKRRGSRSHPYLHLGSDWESYLSGRSRNFRKQRRRRFLRSTRDHQLEVRIADDAPSAGVMFQSLLDLHADRWSVRESSFLLPESQAFHSDLTQLWCPRQRAVLLAIHLDGAPVAARYGFVDHDRFWEHQGGWCTDLARLEPAKMAFEATVQHVMEQGLSEYALMPGAESEKERWTGDSRQLVDLEALSPHQKPSKMEGRPSS